MKRIILFSCFVFAFLAGSAQYSFDSSALALNLKTLSSDLMEGRKTGTDGSKKARTYIIDDLKKIKIEPFVPEYVQPFTISRPASTIEGVNILGVIPGKKKET